MSSKVLNSERNHEVKYGVNCKVRSEVELDLGHNSEGILEVKYEINHKVRFGVNTEVKSKRRPHFCGKSWGKIWKGKGIDVWTSMVSHTQNLCSAFHPSKCTHTQ